ncbi:calcitonin gene-related peptide type 1 receptor-like [Gigantopelta aegis]|uniref:calcitonin gene-related peptide type 1 receptor-like n=1 Tax=Gigantopelta aegis TaxID=1735272 RepID=UPI001B88C079|nr:calcitonin gene-related peptide type 1 receptor-like [Gigantopelta aegis]
MNGSLSNGSSEIEDTQWPSPEAELFELPFLFDIAEARACHETVLSKPYPSDGHLYCNATFDDMLCFNYTLAGQTVFKPCPTHMHPGFNPEAFAEKVCQSDGTWYHHPFTNKSWTDYRPCSRLQEEHSVIMIYISGYALSIGFLAVSLVIFRLFGQLKCNRVTLHQHLFVSYILSGFLWILYYTQVPMRTDSGILAANPIWCRSLHTVTQYTTVCNYCWMLCEGFYLHTAVTKVFTKENRLVWCWLFESNFLWAIVVPVILSLVINLLFVINILRIIVSKLRAFNTNESYQNKRAMRAILILIPLLGLQYLVIPFRPSSGPRALYIFKMVSAFLVSYQVGMAIARTNQGEFGVFVAIIFCFLNGEVVTVLRRKWIQVRHNLDATFFDRRRSVSTTFAITWEDSSTSGVRNGKIFIRKSKTELQSIMKERTDAENKEAVVVLC